jgi:hypothetical protein
MLWKGIVTIKDNDTPVLEAVHQERRRAERQPRRQGPCREKRDGRPRDPHGRRAGQLETGDDVGWAD